MNKAQQLLNAIKERARKQAMERSIDAFYGFNLKGAR